MDTTHSPLAPAVDQAPAYDCRRARAAVAPTAAALPRSDAVAAAMTARPPFACIALLLQGRDALGGMVPQVAVLPSLCRSIL
jgi:hypothetical protein